MNTDMKQDVSESMPAKCRQTVINTRQCVRPAVSQCAKLRTKMTEFQQHRISQDQNRWALINLACPLHHLMRRFYIETCLSGPYFNVQNPTDNMVGEVEPSEGLQALATQEPGDGAVALHHPASVFATATGVKALCLGCLAMQASAERLRPQLCGTPQIRGASLASVVHPDVGSWMMMSLNPLPHCQIMADLNQCPSPTSARAMEVQVASRADTPAGRVRLGAVLVLVLALAFQAMTFVNLDDFGCQ
ncbi:hypothetical protein AK812_SmicGene1361 [Symbiodinium microadriaticum]|uniref:Uncharacterized protein n=1 Tax=Symbiodinium microadriaticum TaxID=2951 RepID=A0A1Q9F4G8_SYMMI|nr:hypothetical protein AK812_SmicGene1361 [Symbiodinium microadriaticum]